MMLTARTTAVAPDKGLVVQVLTTLLRSRSRRLLPRDASNSWPLRGYKALLSGTDGMSLTEGFGFEDTTVQGPVPIWGTHAALARKLPRSGTTT